MIFNEAKIDNKTEKLLKYNPSIKKSTDDYKEIDGESFYADMSEVFSNNTEATFMRKLSDECSKLSAYSVRVIYIPINSEADMTAVKTILKYIKARPDMFKTRFSGLSFIFVNNSTNKNLPVVVDKYAAMQYPTLEKLINEISAFPEVKSDSSAATRKTPTKQIVDKEKVAADKKEKNKEELVRAIAAKAKEVEPEIANASDDDAEQILKQAVDSDEDIARILAQVEEDEKPSINKSRAARMTQVNNEFLKSSIGSTSINSLLFDDKITLEPSHLKVSSINKEEWDKVKFTTFESSYNLNSDIVKMVNSLSDQNKSFPIAIRNISVEDTSTSMDYLLTYKIECEDSFGKRFSFKFDIPKFINNRFMMLRGNEKAMSGQLMLLPCLKTDEDAVQLVTNYKKIFVYRYGMVGKSYPFSDRVAKTVNKYKGTKLKITSGDNNIICTKYELPVDYIDLASNISVITTPDRTYYFDYDIYFKKYNADLSKGLPYAIDRKSNTVIYYNDDDKLMSQVIADELCEADADFMDIYSKTKPANRLNYSQASIMSNRFPLVVLIGYHIGLSNLLKRAKIEFRLGEAREVRNNEAYIRFEDTCLIYKVSYESSMLLNGLSECDTRNYTFAEMDKRSTWLDFLDEFGGRILSDGLENFKDLFMDPITVEICKDCRLPTDYIDLLIYANNLLADNKYNRHTDITGNRYRTNEVVAGYFYIAMGDAYAQYANAVRRGMKNTVFTMKQTAVIDAILTSNISSDLSTLNALLELTTASTATFKGPSGMNSDRAYGLDKRTYDDSMINKLALSTGFSANVGIDRQTTIDMDVDSTRGFIKPTDPDEMSVTKTFSMSEALTPFGVQSDDPFRSAMTYIQTSKHAMRTKKSTPLLITNGADEAMPYMNSATYSVKAEQSGIVEKLTDEYMIIKYDHPVPSDVPGQDGITHRCISLKETVKKNSDGGFYVTVTLVTRLKEGQKFKKDDIIAYDAYSFSKASESDNLAYNLGALTKVAIMNNDEGFEDSTSVSNWLSEALASEVVAMKDTPPLSKSTHISFIAKVGDYIQEGDPLIIYQNAFEEEDANLLLRAIGSEDIVSDLGKIRLKSKYTGVVQDIKIYRTCEINEMSESMAKIVTDYEKKIKATKAMYNKYDIPGANMLDPDYIMPQTGKLKNCSDGIVIEFYVKYNDKLGVGDKCVAQSANKGVVKDIFPVGKEPFTALRPDEKINAVFAARSFNARMVTSVFRAGAINKLLVELDREIKDIMDVPYISVEDANETH